MAEVDIKETEEQEFVRRLANVMVMDGYVHRQKADFIATEFYKWMRRTNWDIKRKYEL